MTRGFVRRSEPLVLYGPVRDPRIGPLGPAEDVLETARRYRKLRDRLILW